MGGVRHPSRVCFLSLIPAFKLILSNVANRSWTLEVIKQSWHRLLKNQISNNSKVELILPFDQKQIRALFSFSRLWFTTWCPARKNTRRYPMFFPPLIYHVMPSEEKHPKISDVLSFFIAYSCDWSKGDNKNNLSDVRHGRALRFFMRLIKLSLKWLQTP